MYSETVPATSRSMPIDWPNSVEAKAETKLSDQPSSRIERETAMDRHFTVCFVTMTWTLRPDANRLHRPALATDRLILA